MTRRDAVDPDYVPLKYAEAASSVSFYLAAALSILALLIPKSEYPKLSSAAQATFAVSVIALFASGIVIRTYFAARAHTKRIADFVSNAFSVPIIPTPSEGYYNNAANDPFVRMAANTLENSLFSKTILMRMLRFERARTGGYLLVWLWALFFRSSDLEILAIVAQAIFSEQLLSRWIRMEWLRSRVERLYDDLYALLQGSSDTTSKEFRARVIEGVIRYETSKAQAAISLSTRVFKAANAELAENWKRLSAQLGLH